MSINGRHSDKTCVNVRSCQIFALYYAIHFILMRVMLVYYRYPNIQTLLFWIYGYPR